MRIKGTPTASSRASQKTPPTVFVLSLACPVGSSSAKPHSQPQPYHQSQAQALLSLRSFGEKIAQAPTRPHETAECPGERKSISPNDAPDSDAANETSTSTSTSTSTPTPTPSSRSSPLVQGSEDPAKLAPWLDFRFVFHITTLKDEQDSYAAAFKKATKKAHSNRLSGFAKTDDVDGAANHADQQIAPVKLEPQPPSNCSCTLCVHGVPSEYTASIGNALQVAIHILSELRLVDLSRTCSAASYCSLKKDILPFVQTHLKLLMSDLSMPDNLLRNCTKTMCKNPNVFLQFDRYSNGKSSFDDQLWKLKQGVNPYTKFINVTSIIEPSTKQPGPDSKKPAQENRAQSTSKKARVPLSPSGQPIKTISPKLSVKLESSPSIGSDKVGPLDHHPKLDPPPLILERSISPTTSHANYEAHITPRMPSPQHASALINGLIDGHTSDHNTEGKEETAMLVGTGRHYTSSQHVDSVSLVGYGANDSVYGSSISGGYIQGGGSSPSPPGGIRANDRRCGHCNTSNTVLWRQGPDGKGTLCNACGVRWKRGIIKVTSKKLLPMTFSHGTSDIDLQQGALLEDGRLCHLHDDFGDKSSTSISTVVRASMNALDEDEDVDITMTQEDDIEDGLEETSSSSSNMDNQPPEGAPRQDSDLGGNHSCV
eukprot:TRINITY_DN3358_c0_g1_i1.p1 TRINITY_DN3358_c0_g1~~TRINITY_DN3358_c0_g1_i1.p1  ORF type:complete len:655 (-),score=113.58 TRINITY_DN3358_c0_g1_i1:874-2838(-)